MSIILLMIILILAKDSQFVNDEHGYLSRKTTDGVRGLFVILIFMSHYVTYIQVGDYDSVYLILREHLNQAVVVPFLFYSGYGMFLQYEKQETGYLKRIVFRKIPGILIRLAVAVCCFWILRSFQGYKYSPKKMVLTFLAWDSIGSSNWYVFGIIGEFLIFFVSYGIFTRNEYQINKVEKILSVAIVIYLTVAFVKWLRYMGRPAYCYNTLMMFPCGVLWANLRKKLALLLSKYTWICLLLTLVLYNITFQHRFLSLKWYLPWTVMFMIICLLFSTRIRIDGRILQFCANHVFSIYILQRLPMIMLAHIGWTYESPYISFFISAIATGLIAFMFDRLFSIAWKKWSVHKV